MPGQGFVREPHRAALLGEETGPKQIRVSQINKYHVNGDTRLTSEDKK